VLWRIVRLNRSTERARDAIAHQERYYRAVATNSSDAFLVVDRDARVLDASAALHPLTGFSPGAVVGADSMAIVIHEDRGLAETLFLDSIGKPGLTVTGEVRIGTADGSTLWVELRCTNLLDDPAVSGIVVNTHDITARKQIERELEHQAFHDSLTSLANRALLKDRIDHALARRAPDNEIAVVFCDLDGFKLVNDTLGHDAGNEMLRIAARRLSAAVRAGDTVARLGGDEFGVLLEGTSRPIEDAAVIAERMRDALADPAEVAGVPLVVTGSLGYVVASGGAQTTSEELLRDADTAMYRAKTAGRNQVARYLPSMRAADLSRAQIESDLRVAVERGEFLVHYQPVVQLNTRRLVGFEALVRWDHPTRGRLQPDDFISIAEETGAIVDIGKWVLNSACRTARSWQVRMPHGASLTMSVNLSALQLKDPGLVTDVADALAMSELPAAALVLELTESVIVEQPDEVAARFRALKALGVRLAIDDFGVGYSSLAYLRQFPVDILKIDRSFVEVIQGDEQAPAIVHGLLELARTLGFETIAEGIETDAQWRSLDREGCQFGQGYLFGKPHGEQVATRLLERQWRFDRHAASDLAASASRNESTTAAAAATVSAKSG
jgi:diguanylate cyclase (GGDEF)-like protein/PAS domain S-box-containing protein